MAKYGRDEDQLKITPGLSEVVAASDQEAQDKFGELQALVDVSGFSFGRLDLSGYSVDEPLPDLPYEPPENVQGRFWTRREARRCHERNTRDNGGPWEKLHRNILNCDLWANKLRNVPSSAAKCDLAHSFGASFLVAAPSRGSRPLCCRLPTIFM